MESCNEEVNGSRKGHSEFLPLGKLLYLSGQNKHDWAGNQGGRFREIEPILPKKHISQLNNYHSEEVDNCPDPFSAAITKSWRLMICKEKCFF